MKITSLILLSIVGVGLSSAPAANVTRSVTFTENTALYDGTGVGNGFYRISSVFSDMPGATLAGVSVMLDINGGYNGQLYAYLSKGSGFSVLLNRCGRAAGNTSGYIDPGLLVNIKDTASNGDIHAYTPNNQATRLIGEWAPDGRETDPASTLDTDARTSLLSSFAGVLADGSWTLYVEDVVSGQQATLTDWELIMSVDTVPEPQTWAMMGLTALSTTAYAIRLRRQRRTGVAPVCERAVVLG